MSAALEREFEEFLANCDMGPEELPYARRWLRRAFYSGALVVFSSVRDGASNKAEAADVAKRLYAEIGVFVQEVNEGRA